MGELKERYHFQWKSIQNKIEASAKIIRCTSLKRNHFISLMLT